ncbi:MAG: hypothetical protein MJE77_08070 [Proteobacteria bacterium]|nr:hypothetical protein [Pseudomonadota bacterium]
MTRCRAVVCLLVFGLALPLLSCTAKRQRRPPIATFVIDLSKIPVVEWEHQPPHWPFTVPAQAWREAIKELLDMPAPAADWKPFVKYASQPPPADVDEEILLAWWNSPAFVTVAHSPSEYVRRRLIDALPRDPTSALALRHEIGKDSDARALIASILARDGKKQHSSIPPDDRERLENWLAKNAPRDLDELRRSVAQARVPEGESHVSDNGALDDLMERRPGEAVRLLEEHAENPDPILAAWAVTHLLHHALTRGKTARADQFRVRLRAVVADTTMRPVVRAQTILSLMNHDWDGRDQWFMSLFADPTVNLLGDGQSYWLPIEAVVKEQAERLVPLVVKLIGHGTDHTHNLAVRCLARVDRPEAMRPLLPWLMDPDWSRGTTLRGFTDVWSRAKLVKNLATVHIAEAIPGLRHYLATGRRDYRVEAAIALARQYSVKEAVPDIYEAVAEAHYVRDRTMMLEAITVLEPITAERGLDNLEWYARVMTEEKTRKILQGMIDDWSAQAAIPPGVSIGMFLATEQPRVSDELASETLRRSLQLAFREPDTAFAMHQTAMSWPSIVVARHAIEDWKRGFVNGTELHSVLEHRGIFADALRGELRALLPDGRELAGLAAVMLGRAAPIKTILRGRDERAQIALLAAARLVRHPISVADVKPLLAGRGRRLTMAAERYLKSLDTGEAREALYERHPGEFLILGARQDFPGIEDPMDGFHVLEKELVERIRTDETMDELWGLVSYSDRDGGSIEVIIEVRGDRATLIRGDSKRLLADAERHEWETFLREKRILELPPLNSDVLGQGSEYEFIHLTRRGGQRLKMNYPGFRDPASPYHLLARRLHWMR